MLLRTMQNVSFKKILSKWWVVRSKTRLGFLLLQVQKVSSFLNNESQNVSKRTKISILKNKSTMRYKLTLNLLKMFLPRSVRRLQNENLEILLIKVKVLCSRSLNKPEDHWDVVKSTQHLESKMQMHTPSLCFQRLYRKRL